MKSNEKTAVQKAVEELAAKWNQTLRDSPVDIDRLLKQGQEGQQTPPTPPKAG